MWSLGAVYPALLQRGAVGKETRIKNTVSFQCAFLPPPPFLRIKKHGGEGSALLSQLGVAGVTRNRLIHAPLRRYLPHEFLIHLGESVSVGD